VARCVHLFSGGLDSIVSLRLLESLGVEVLPVTYYSVFFPPRRAGARAGVEPVRIDLTERMIEVVKAPRHGYGSAMNPCMDCRITMLREAGRMMRETGADFVSTGEVAGQRPMTQFIHLLPLTEREAGLEGLVLRPLSAKLLKPTIPETSGVVDRERLLDIRGRSRRRQIALAEEFGIKDAPQPAGGCRLTDANYAKRVKLLLRDGYSSSAEFELLACGRFFRLSGKARLIVGRCEEENGRLDAGRPTAALRIEPVSVVGPVALMFGPQTSEALATALEIVTRYSDAKEGEEVTLELRRGDETPRLAHVIKRVFDPAAYRL